MRGAASADGPSSCRERVEVACRDVGTDIYGGIEYRHPGAGSDWYDGDTWLTAISLWPLYDETDYVAFACLFGARNYAGYAPIAANRGLPADISAGLRADLAGHVAAGEMDCASWVNWAELAALDPSAVPERFVGRLTWTTTPPASAHHYQRMVGAEWPVEVCETVGAPPADWEPGMTRMQWETEELKIRYESLAVGAVLGPGTQWPHVFAVMSALAGRFGDEGVRLVVAFD